MIVSNSSNYKEDPDNKVKIVSLLDLAVLVYNLQLARRERSIGHEDTQMSFSSLLDVLNKKVPIKRLYIEKALWASVMLEEEEAFFHPRGLHLDAFISRFVDESESYSKTYCMFMDNKKNETSSV